MNSDKWQTECWELKSNVKDTVRRRTSSDNPGKHNQTLWQADSYITLRPWPRYVPKVPTTLFQDKLMNLQVLALKEADQAFILLCPIHALHICGPNTELLELRAALCLLWRLALDSGCHCLGEPSSRQAVPPRS